MRGVGGGPQSPPTTTKCLHLMFVHTLGKPFKDSFEVLKFELFYSGTQQGICFKEELKKTYDHLFLGGAFPAEYLKN